MEGLSAAGRFRDRMEAIDAEMRSHLWAASPLLEPFYGMMAYHLGWRDADLRPADEPVGKRLRPLLCLLACEAVGGAWPLALPAAAAVELLHNFTLIHDDIEDHTPLRRGRPAVWSLWGVPQAINAGDGLFVLARMALLRLRSQPLPPEVVLEAVAQFDWAILRICEGQYLDLDFEGRLDVDEPSYLGMIARKTAALLETSLYLGALIGGGSEDLCASLRAYGRELGLAFQMQDDVLGVWGEQDRTGKPAAADVYGRKLGLPVIHALTGAKGNDRAVLEQVYGGSGAVHEEDVVAVRDVLERMGSRAYVEGRAAVHHDEALRALEGIAAGPAREALEHIARSLLGRQS